MRYETSVVVDRPIEDVWASLVNPFNIPRWNPSWLGIRPASPAPLGPGSTFQARMRLFGFEIRLDAEIVDWDPPRAGSFSVRGPIGSGSLRARLEETGAGTRLVRGTDIEPRPLLKPLFWIAGPLIRRRSAVYDQQFKRVIEADSPDQGKKQNER
jgi:carbon monoxide dehydrogenase subunit G